VQRTILIDILLKRVVLSRRVSAYYPNALKAATAQPAADGTGEVHIGSSPANADVYVDGKFIGNAPATLSLSIGPHRIAVKMEGYKDWERTLEVMKDSTSL
jgi:hypothetical protein